MTELDKNAVINSDKWLNSSIDIKVKDQIIDLKKNNIDEFNDAFIKHFLLALVVLEELWELVQIV